MKADIKFFMAFAVEHHNADIIMCENHNSYDLLQNEQHAKFPNMSRFIYQPPVVPFESSSPPYRIFSYTCCMWDRI